MDCSKCGNEITQGSYFCSKCGNQFHNQNNTQISAEPTKYVAITSNKSKTMAIKLCIFGILANLILGFIFEATDFHYPILLFAGVHRFYVGKIWSGIIYTFTFGLLLIGSIFDLIQLTMGQFTDNVGQPLRR